MRKIWLGTVVLAGVMVAGHALAGPFEVSPRGYGSLINRALAQVRSDLRFQFEKCEMGSRLACNFSSERVRVLVQGRVGPPQTGNIIIGADLLREKPDAERLAALSDCMLTLRATMMIFDPNVSAERRNQLLSKMTAAALDTGEGKDEGADARYSLIFDEATSGRLSITVIPMNQRSVTSAPL